MVLVQKAGAPMEMVQMVLKEMQLQEGLLVVPQV